MRGVLLAIAAAMPLVAGDIQLFQLTGVLVFAIALLGLNILVGYNGQISLGHGAFLALGGYCAALLVTHTSVPQLAAILVAAVVSLAAGFVFGLPAARLPAIHLAMATLALGAVLPNVVKHKAIEAWTGGSSGLALERREVPFGLPLSFDQWLYLLTLAVLVLLLVLASNLLRGRVGRAVIAIRDDPTAAQAFGVDATLYRSVVFGISAMYAGVAGALSALSVQYVAPGIYGVFLSFTLLAGIAIGGIGSLSGALYGALVLQGIQLLSAAGARSLGTAHVYAFYGALLLLVVYIAPRGIAGLFDRRARYFRWY